MLGIWNWRAMPKDGAQSRIRIDDAGDIGEAARLVC